LSLGSQIARYEVTNSDSSRNGCGRSEYSLRLPSGRTTTKRASSRMASCRDTPGWPMSTTWTSSPTERSPRLSASTIRRRVGSARTWKTSATTTYYYSDICRVNNTSGADRLQATQLRQQLGDLLGRPLGVVAAQVDDLLGHAQLVVLARQFDQVGRLLALPAELQRLADLRRVPADRDTRVLELADHLLDEGGVAARDIPHVRVTRGQPERTLALGADPQRRVRLLHGLG